ncbi:synaptic vesicle glycoprotein 2Ca isoform X2 [Pleuronectes platessa]|uniref:synaptic vesicle glycoprotein 2Ca isoform X2 n=1 Tax=Pleuronectes platessa TaxID=8262 RepID=UPI00232A201C|nr:synaptic vesicle glycoprotein 2Ca isoform X2 [Pleuronectes platessa]
MEDTYNNRTSLAKGAKDIVKEAKRHATKKVGKAVDRATDEYSSHRNYSRFQDEEDEDEDFYKNPPRQHGEGNQDNEEGSSDATEGHDDEDEIYEGEYQGIPSAGDSKHKDGQVALGQLVSDATRDRKELDQEREADEEELAQQYELIIQECGHGRFQWQLFLVLGLALMSDGVEVFVVGFVLPSAETDMCVPNSSSGWLGSVVYLGMMVGALFWGGMSDKVGRRQILLICMSTNGFFAFLSSFVQGYGVFLLCRLVAGFGIGGAVPIVFSFFAEVLSREKRGEHLSWLCMFWMIGEIYASAMAWAIIPHYGWSFSMGSAYQFHSWRVFVVVCALPCVCAVVALTFMPESPRFYLEVGKHDEAWMILKQIHDTNMRARGQPEKVFTVNRIKIPKQLDELVEMQSESGNSVSKFFFRIKAETQGIYHNLMKCFNYPMRENMMRLATVWFTLSFGYYGLSVWFPDVIKHLQADDYASKVKIHSNERIEDFTFNFTLENQIHKNGLFINDRFINMKLKSVTFIDSTFRNCYFDDVTSVGSFFRNCTFIDAFFFNTGGSMVLSGISCFFLWFGTSESMMIFMLCLYNGLSISAWNSLDVVTTESFPTSRRGTGFGFCNALCKLAAVLGNLFFGSLVGITKAIPILMASSVLVCGGLVGLRLPDTRANVLM